LFDNLQSLVLDRYLTMSRSW